MIRSIQSFFFALTILILACENEQYFNFGFNTQIREDSFGSLKAEISDTDEIIMLKGFIVLSEGELEVILYNSNDAAVYSETVTAPTTLEVDKIFDPQQGTWKFIYISRNGKGKIDLHLSNLHF